MNESTIVLMAVSFFAGCLAAGWPFFSIAARWKRIAAVRERNFERSERAVRLLYLASGLERCEPAQTNDHCPYPKGHSGTCWPAERERWDAEIGPSGWRRS